MKFSYPSKEKRISEVARIGSIIISHLSKLWKAKFFTVWWNIYGEAVGKFEIDHSSKWKGQIARYSVITEKLRECNFHFYPLKAIFIHSESQYKLPFVHASKQTTMSWT